MDSPSTDEKLRDGLRTIAEWGRPEGVPALPAAHAGASASVVDFRPRRIGTRVPRATWWAVAACMVVVAGLVVAGNPVAREEEPLAPALGAWSPMAPAPIPGRANPAVAWTGTEMVIVGGQGADGKWRRDAAAYNPSTNRWRRLPDASDVVPGGVSAAWTGTHVIVFVGGPSTSVVSTPTRNGSRAPIALDMTTLEWGPAENVGRGFDFAALDVGGRVFDLASAGNGTHLMELVDGDWVRVRTFTHADVDDPWAWQAVRTENRAVFVPNAASSATSKNAGFVVDVPAEGTPEITMIPKWPGGAEHSIDYAKIAVVDDVVLFSGRIDLNQDDDGSDRPRFTARFDLSTWRWRDAAELRERPEDDSVFMSTPMVGTPSGVVLIGGTNTGPGGREGVRVLYDNAADEWLELPEAPIDLERVGHVVWWTGDSLLVWGGLLDEKGRRSSPDTPAHDGARLVLRG